MLAKARMAASEKGYENGIRAMPVKERMAASKKGYENGLGAMPAESRMAAREKEYEKGSGAMSAAERMAVSEKGSNKARSETSNNKMGIKWETRYTEFERCIVMPEERTTLHTWQQYQLSNGSKGLNDKIWKELAKNEGSTVWSDRRVKLFDCVSQKRCDKLGNKWESKYAEFKQCLVMPGRGTTLYSWQSCQLSTGAASLNAKIQKEIEENKEGTVWSKQRPILVNCIAQKRRE